MLQSIAAIRPAGSGGLLWAGTVALSVSAIGASFSPVAFFRAYLAAYLFYLGIALGSMVLLMVYHLTGGSWGFLIRRILEAGMRTLPLLAVLFLPIACGIRYLYLWAQPDVVAASPQLQYQQFYLAPTYFWIRAAVYFAVWLAMAFLLASWSRKEDETGRTPIARLAWKSQQLGAFGAVAYGISLHFAAIDWGMSLQPVFHSTIWGPLFATGQLLSALAFALVVLAWRVNRPPLAEVDSPKVRNDLASLLLTLLIVWAYMAWFQFMLIWIANLPVDVVWYLPRATSPWQWVMWAIVLFHFTVPFFLLLVRRDQAEQQGRRLDCRPDPFHAPRVHGLPGYPRLSLCQPEGQLDGFSRSHRDRGNLVGALPVAA